MTSEGKFDKVDHRVAWNRTGREVQSFFWVLFWLLVQLGHPTLVSVLHAQSAPAQLNWQSLDLQKLDRAQCDRLRQNPITCPDGPQNQLCKTTKVAVETICTPILAQTTYFDFVPDNVRKALTENLAVILVTLIGLASAAITAWINQKRSQFAKLRAEVAQKDDRVKALERRVMDPFFQRPMAVEQYATNMILIGEGGSGKTTIIHALTSSDKVRPDVATGSLDTFAIIKEITVVKDDKITRRIYRIYTDDYVGQEWTQGTLNPYVRKRQEIVRSSTLVIVVDLVEPTTRTDPQARQEEYSRTRVRDQLSAYNDLAIQTLVNLVGPGGQVVLFINKIDLIYPLTDEKLASIRQAYAPLIRRLSDLRGIRFHIIFGSAATGRGVVGFADGENDKLSLQEVIYKHAEQIDLERIGGT